MKYFAVFALIFVAVSAQEPTCSKDADDACNRGASMLLPNCNALYGGMKYTNLVSEMQQYANLHLKRSFEHLLVSTHFANYINNRPGFEKLFRQLSDEAWENGIELIKHIGKRGAVHNFKEVGADSLKMDGSYEKYELEAMTRAVDVQKHLANEALKIHKTALRNHEHVHDTEIAHYIEEKFAGKHAEQIKTLVGHVVDLKKFAESKDASLALHLFDEYLMKA